MYVTDILPTLLNAANISINDNSLDGFNQWDTISLGMKSPRKEILYNLDQIVGFSGLLQQQWKVVNGSENIKYSDWFGSSGREHVNISVKSYIKDVLQSEAALSLPKKLDPNLISALRHQATVFCGEKKPDLECNPLAAPCLFNVIDDPCEFNNLADMNPGLLATLLSRVDNHYKNIIPTRRKFSDANCDPKNFNL